MQTKRAQIQALRNDLDEVRQLAQTQALLIDDITTAQTTTSTYRGNAYVNYGTAVKELARKYEGTATWGVFPTTNLVDIRAAFIIGQGVSVYPVDKLKSKAEKEMEFVKAFFDYNDIDREMAQEFAKEAEIEGRFLGQLFWDEKAQMPSVRFRAWTASSYTIETDSNDYSRFLKVKWKSKTGGQEELTEDEFVYARFAGRVHQPELPYPKIAKCLGQIEALDKALKDWTEITRLFASPIPHVECEDAQQASWMKENIKDAAKNWKIKRLFAHTGKLGYLTPDASSIQYLEKLILTLAKMISGATGVPVGLMGLGDLTTKLGSSSEITADQLSATTSKEREVWMGTYQQIISKAMAMWSSKKGKTPLDPKVIQVSIPFITNETWKRIADVWLPAYLSDAITLKTLLAQIPSVNVDEEIAAMGEQNKADIEKIKAGKINKSKPDEGDEDE